MFAAHGGSESWVWLFSFRALDKLTPYSSKETTIPAHRYFKAVLQKVHPTVHSVSRPWASTTKPWIRFLMHHQVECWLGRSIQACFFPHGPQCVDSCTQRTRSEAALFAVAIAPQHPRNEPQARCSTTGWQMLHAITTLAIPAAAAIWFDKIFAGRR
jgi:hypothetical protein